MGHEVELELLKSIENAKKMGFVKPSIQDYIFNNINDSFELREYQKEAFKNYLIYFDSEIQKHPSHLMFNMATGSGKTLMMVLSILDLYKKGYRDFIFFVNSTTIIDKTKENFLNPSSNKYLFSNKIWINDKEVKIRQIDNIEESDDENINILFTTIQKMHSDLNEAKENSITYNDFKDKEIVLLSDEAHHVNALTKSKSRRTKTDEENINSWEETINNIFYANKNNVMLEYTATIDLSHEDIYEKYKDKIIYRYTLKDYREDGFSKDISLLRSEQSKKNRILQALISSQFRKKLAEDNHIYLKPVIMFKSYKIAESEKHKNEFHNLISNLKTKDLEDIKELSEKPKIIEDAFEYFEKKNIDFKTLIDEFKIEFDITKCIKVDSKSDLEDEQVLVNSLEDRNNEIRVIFAVNKLNEGWDVLNLFDIVRLGEIKKTKKKTNQEAQLIGRGARYYPFWLEDKENKFIRKFDNEPDNELRYLEKLYYHSINANKFINGLTKELKDRGIYIDENDKKEIELNLKDDFKESEFYQEGKIYLNKKKKKDPKKINKLQDLYDSKRYYFGLSGESNYEEEVFKETIEANINKKTNIYEINDFDDNITRAALNKIPFYKFDNLNSYLVNLNSISEFITSENYLKKVKIEITGSESKLNNLTRLDKLHILIKILKDIKKDIKNNFYRYEGTEKFDDYYIKEVIKDKKMYLLKNNPSSISIDLEMENKDWYAFKNAYGTSQEKNLIKMVHNNIEKLKGRFSTVKLIRNERMFALYDFKAGRRFEPDFVLFLEEKIDKGDEIVWYQVFIEPKGEHLYKEDKWKEDFLLEIEEKYQLENILETKDYKLYGLPFYNSKEPKITEFERGFFGKLKLKK